MSFVVNNNPEAFKPAGKAPDTKSKKLNAPGRYKVKVVEFRHNPETEDRNQSFFIDLEIVEGPRDIGMITYVAWFDDPSKYTTTFMPDGRQFTGKQKRAKDVARFQGYVAAALGLSKPELLTQEQADQAFAGQAGKGNLCILEAVAYNYESKKTKQTETGFELTLRPATAHDTVSSDVPEIPEVADAGEWKVHPKNPAYEFNTVTKATRKRA